ncbi:hypothetical protein L209DRAFT_755160 [Thermothelomyces heterothallicus CBS 203.75]
MRMNGLELLGGRSEHGLLAAAAHGYVCRCLARALTCAAARILSMFCSLLSTSAFVLPITVPSRSRSLLGRTTISRPSRYSPVLTAIQVAAVFHAKRAARRANTTAPMARTPREEGQRERDEDDAGRDGEHDARLPPPAAAARRR